MGARDVCSRRWPWDSAVSSLTDEVEIRPGSPDREKEGVVPAHRLARPSTSDECLLVPRFFGTFCDGQLRAPAPMKPTSLDQPVDPGAGLHGFRNPQHTVRWLDTRRRERTCRQDHPAQRGSGWSRHPMRTSTSPAKRSDEQANEVDVDRQWVRGVQEPLDTYQVWAVV